MGDDLREKTLRLEQKGLAVSKPKTLPAWPEGKRGTPSSFLRSALFAATKSVQDEARERLNRQIIASQQGIEIRFTGDRLDQDDLTLWEALVHLAKDHPLGTICEFTAYSILKTMGLGDGGRERERLHKGIIRLTACAVEISLDGAGSFFSPLIHSGTRDNDSGHYTIQLSTQLSSLYKQATWLDWEQRAKLRRKPLAQALHGYYSSHKSPYPVKIETLHKLTGSKSKKMFEFKQRLIKALDDLVAIGFISRYEVVDNLVIVEK